tara:strand:- start:94 stop:339 length:246 start_codon:yes stop_codon:yes gene_type:complete
MLKALLVIVSISGHHGDQLPMESSYQMASMKQCLEAVKDLKKQDQKVTAICIPHEDPKESVKEMFYVFMDIVDQIKEKYPD